LVRLRSNPEIDIDSIFHPDRSAELASIVKKGDWVIAGWGALPTTHKCLRAAAKLALKNLEDLSGRPVAGKKSASGIRLGRCHPRFTVKGGAYPSYYTAWRGAVATAMGLDKEDIKRAERRLKVDGISSKNQLWSDNDQEFTVDLALDARAIQLRTLKTPPKPGQKRSRKRRYPPRK
jgi:hypothetical protein